MHKTNYKEQTLEEAMDILTKYTKQMKYLIEKELNNLEKSNKNITQENEDNI